MKALLVMGAIFWIMISFSVTFFLTLVVFRLWAEDRSKNGRNKI